MRPFFDHFILKPCGRNNELFDIFFLTNLFLHFSKVIEFQISGSHTTKMSVKNTKVKKVIKVKYHATSIS